MVELIISLSPSSKNRYFLRNFDYIHYGKIISSKANIIYLDSRFLVLPHLLCAVLDSIAGIGMHLGLTPV